MTTWTDIQPWVLAFIPLTPLVFGWVQGKLKLNIPRVYGRDSKRRKVRWATRLISVGGTVAIVALVGFGWIGVFIWQGWLSATFPWFGYYLFLLGIEVVGVVCARTGIWLTGNRPDALDGYGKALAWLGYKPTEARRVAKLTASDPDPDEDEE